LQTRLLALLAAFVGAGALLAMPAAASHSWSNYHWARTANPFTLKIIDANSSAWDPYLDQAIADWDKSTVLTLVKETGAVERQCKAVTGKVKSCNGTYGQNGWLGLASIQISGSHITSGTSKMNDTYFNMAQYNNPTKKQHVMCQEIGHDFGLAHQDESGADFNTCMDYSNALDNPSPNQHDYDQLQSIYAHLDPTTTVAASTMAESSTARPVKVDRVDRISTSTITEEFADRSVRVTHVTWALETRGRSHEYRFDPGHEHG
jgi:hypothetical protein